MRFFTLHCRAWGLILLGAIVIAVLSFFMKPSIASNVLYCVIMVISMVGAVLIFVFGKKKLINISDSENIITYFIIIPLLIIMICLLCCMIFDMVQAIVS